MTRWTDIARQTGDDYAHVYAARFRANAEAGQEINGEALAAAALVAPPARILDAGCGTGVMGVDIDEAMLAVAREDAPELDWRQGDLATLDLGEAFDLMLLAGNIIPLLEPGSLGAVAERLAVHTQGLLICGFGLDSAHLPSGCPVTPLADYDAAMSQAGFTIRDRWSTWDGQPFDEARGYVVTVHDRR